VVPEANGRERLAYVENNDAGTLEHFAEGQLAAHTQVVMDGHAGYSAKSLGKRPHEAVVQTKAERRQKDVVQGCHWTISLLKRWLIGTHAGAVRDEHLQAYLDEFAFRHKPPQNERPRPHRSARHREPRRSAAHNAQDHRRDDAFPLVRFNSGSSRLS
jgi:hypothetical protein